MEATATPRTQPAPPPRLRERYEQEILPALTQKFGYTTPMQAPRLVKITLNMGLGEAKQDKRMLEAAQERIQTAVEQAGIHVASQMTAEQVARTELAEVQRQMVLRVNEFLDSVGSGLDVTGIEALDPTPALIGR